MTNTTKTLQDFEKEDRETFYAIVNGEKTPFDVAKEAYLAALDACRASLPRIEEQGTPDGQSFERAQLLYKEKAFAAIDSLKDPQG